MNAPHPAYPAPADLAREARAEAIATAAWRNNERLRDILRLCRDKIADRVDLDSFSMVPGMDLRDVLDTLDACMPDLHDDERNAALDEWATDRAEGE